MERSEVEYATAAPGERRKSMGKVKEAVRLNVVAITSGCAHVQGRDVIFREGEIFAADDALVKQCPLFFVPVDATSQEVHDAKVGRDLYHRVL
jgi:hypothetical protein